MTFQRSWVIRFQGLIHYFINFVLSLRFFFVSLTYVAKETTRYVTLYAGYSLLTGTA